MYVDYVRVYQRDDAPGIGCSPEDYPTEDYVNKCELPLHYFDFRVLTKKQPFECLYEPQPYNVEPSRVLFPAQLVIQRLLDSCAITSILVLLFSATPHTIFPRTTRYAQILYPESPRSLMPITM